METSFIYDSIGRISSFLRGDGFGANVGYDEFNRISGSRYKTVDGSRGSWYTYVNGTGLVSKVNFDGYSVQNTFDELNRTEARKYTFGSNKSVFETMDYNRVGNRTDGKVMSHSFGGSYEFNYEYDQNGNITRISDDSGNLRNEYTYDELGRLTSEINIPKGSQSSKAVVGEKIEYLYSKDGNIYQRNFYKVQALQGKTYVDAKANRSDSFGYSNTEWSDQLSSARINGKGFNFTYDKIGNPLNYRDGMVMTWQNGRQLKSIKVDDTTTLEFTYDINGQRQSKVEKKNGTAVHTTKYYYDGTKLVGENKDGTIVWYDYDENGTPVGMRLSGDDYVFRRNLQGDITGIFDSTGTLVVEYTYGNAWGFGITVSGSKAAEIGACNSLRYRGYYYDSESGLYYLNTRYYDSSICRFVNADGYVSTGQGTQGYNMYSYCVFNPVNMVDQNGEDPIPIWAKNILYGDADEGDYLEALSCNPNAWSGSAGYIVRKAVNKANNYYNFIERTKGPRKDPRKGADTRRKTGARERNVAHPNGEEHSRVAKGNGRNIKRVSVTDVFASIGVLVVASIGIAVVCADDVTLIGIANDAAIAPLIKIVWDCTATISKYCNSGG